MIMKKIYILYILFVLIKFELAGNQLKWAADAEGNAPYIFQDPNSPQNLLGFEKDIIEEISKILKLKPVFIQNQWDGLIPGLYRMDYDVAANGIEITPEREKEVLFSIPYYITHLTIVIKNNNNYISNFQDLINKKVGVLKNSLAERILLKEAKIKTLTYEGEINAFEDLKNGRIDAVLADDPIVLYYLPFNNELKALNDEIGEAKYAIAIRKNDLELKDRIDSALKLMIKSGKLRDILESWKLWNNQMKDYTFDYSESKILPINYNNYVSLEIKNITIEERIVRYVSFFPLIIQATIVTLQISTLSMLLAIVFGLFLALFRLYIPAPFNKISILYIEIIRGTPLLIQLFFIFYALPSIGISFSPFVAAILGLGLNYAAYEAENYRAGLLAVPKGQFEAALALGLNRRQSLRYIILPQALRIVIPPVTNDFISLLKDSSLVSVITLVELTKLYTQLSATYFDYIGTGIIIALVYLLLGLPFIRFSNYFEEKFKYDKKVLK